MNYCGPSICNGMFFSLNMEGNADPHCNVDEPRGHYAERKRTVTKGQILSDSTSRVRRVRFVETESRTVGSGRARAGTGEPVFRGDGVAGREGRQNVLEMDGGDVAQQCEGA